MLLSEAVDRYATLRDLSPNSRYQLRHAVESLGISDSSELCDEVVSAWVAGLRPYLAPKTVHGRRAAVLTLWRWLHAAGLAPRPGEISAIKVPRKNPEAWTREEVDRLLAAAAGIDGYLGNGLPRRLYFPTLLRTAYETGLRRGDLLGLRWDAIRDDGRIAVTMSKTRHVHVCRVSSRTRDDIRVVHYRLRQDGQDGARPLAWPHSEALLYHWLGGIRRAAGLRSGSLQQARRTGATHVEQRQPGGGTRYLGHLTPGLAGRSYLDRSQLTDPELPW